VKRCNTRLVMFIVMMVSILSAPGRAQTTIPTGTMMLYTTIDKATLAPGESVNIEVWAKIDPGVGTPVKLIGPTNTWDATVKGFGSAHFNLLVDGPKGGWAFFDFNPDLMKITSITYGENILGNIALIQQTPVKTEADPILLGTTAWTPNEYVPGTTVDFNMQWIASAGKVILDIPDLGTQGGVFWPPSVGPASSLTIIPAPGVVWLLGAAGVLTRDRRRR
jgi:hypothetical protein